MSSCQCFRVMVKLSGTNRKIGACRVNFSIQQPDFRYRSPSSSKVTDEETSVYNLQKIYISNRDLGKHFNNCQLGAQLKGALQVVRCVKRVYNRCTLSICLVFIF